MKSVLVFESDSAFAESLVSGLASYGCAVSVVDDGEAGIAAAEKNRPDLILLSIELPRMNGFSVCNKLKRSAVLKDVPLLLMSSEATEETFEQHKRLRTRAEDYVHKPITVEQLVGRIRAFVPLDGAPVDDEVTIVDDESTLDVDLEDETDAVFGSIMSKKPEIPVAAPAATAAAEDVIIDDLELDEEDGLEVAPPEPVVERREDVRPAVSPAVVENSAEVEALRAELAALKANAGGHLEELAKAEENLKAALAAKDQLVQKKDAEADLLQKELDELKLKLSSNQGSGSAREFLDLREQLNKKDKELIDLRDQLTSREREIVRLNDTNIALERDKADSSDKVRELETAKAQLEKTRDALSEDKAQATKRGDDFKAKSERLTEELETKVAELRTAKESHEASLASRDAQEAALREDHKKQLADAAEAAEAKESAAVSQAIREAEERAAKAEEAALAASAVEAEKAKALALTAREGELKSEHDAKMAALHRANEEAMRKLRAEHQQAELEAAQAAADRLSLRERELADEKASALLEQKADSDALYQKLADEKAAAEASRDAKIASLSGELAAVIEARDAAKNLIVERDGRIAQLEAELATRGEEIREYKSTISDREASISSLTDDLTTRTSERDLERQTVVERDRRIGSLEAEVASTRADLVQTADRLASESTALEAARSKWSQDKGSLKAAKAALAAALGEIEAAEGRPMA